MNHTSYKQGLSPQERVWKERKKVKQVLVVAAAAAVVVVVLVDKSEIVNVGDKTVDLMNDFCLDWGNSNYQVGIATRGENCRESDIDHRTVVEYRGEGEKSFRLLRNLKEYNYCCNAIAEVPVESENGESDSNLLLLHHSN